MPSPKSDHERSRQHDRKRQDQQYRGNQNVEDALDDTTQPALPIAFAVDQPAHLQRFDRHLAVDALEKPGEVGHFHAVEPAIEQLA